MSNGLLRIAVGAGLTAIVTTPVALAASAGRGYLAGIGFAMLTLFLAQILGVLGWGAYFPWSVAALYTGAAGDAGGSPVSVSYILVVITGLVGVAGVILWWQLADQTA
jgi:ABC-2 type transport system permease protein